MRKSKVGTAKTRKRIVKAAGAEFAANRISEAAPWPLWGANSHETTSRLVTQPWKDFSNCPG